MTDLTPIVGCSGCAGTAGRLGCPTHSPNAYVGGQVRPFAHLVLRCPWCGKDMQMDCFKVETIEAHKL